MNDFNESVKILKTLIIRAKQFNLPSMAAKGYKHLAEYFLGKVSFLGVKLLKVNNEMNFLTNHLTINFKFSRINIIVQVFTTRRALICWEYVI